MTRDDRPPSVGIGRGGIRWPRLARIVTIALLVAAAARFVAFLAFVPLATTEIGLDYHVYMDATRSWLATGAFYPAWQLAGPFTISRYLVHGEILYPPNALPLFAVFTALPALLWWAIPIAITVIAIWRLRPAVWAYPILAFLLLWPRTQEILIVGNPAMWCVAAVTAAAAWGWPGALVLIKPSLFPFAAIGVWRRAWWLALAGMLVLTVPFIGLWAQWLTVVGNTTNGLLYSIIDVPTMLIGVVAWLASPIPKPAMFARLAAPVLGRIARVEAGAPR